MTRRLLFFALLFLFLGGPERAGALHLRVVSDRPQVDLYVDATRVGPLPALYCHVKPGRYRFTCLDRKTGETIEQESNLVRSGNRRVDLRMRFDPGETRIYFPSPESYDGVLWRALSEGANQAFLDLREIAGRRGMHVFMNDNQIGDLTRYQTSPFPVRPGMIKFRCDPGTAFAGGKWGGKSEESLPPSRLADATRQMALGPAALAPISGAFWGTSGEVDVYRNTGSKVFLEKGDVLLFPEVEFEDQLAARLAANRGRTLTEARTRLKISLLVPLQGGLRLLSETADLFLGEEPYARLAGGRPITFQGGRYQAWSFDELVPVNAGEPGLRFALNRRGTDFFIFQSFSGFERIQAGENELRLVARLGPNRLLRGGGGLEVTRWAGDRRLGSITRFARKKYF